MTLFRNRYRIETTRLRTWDYGATACYFVTICVQHRRCLFGDIVNQEMVLNPMGEIAADQWIHTLAMRKLDGDVFIVMPNHVHLVFGIVNAAPVARGNGEGVGNQFGPLQTRSLQAAINGFKGAVTTACKRAGFAEFAWQSRYYEHVVRGEDELQRIRTYVVDNPARWDFDHNHDVGLWM